MLYILTDAKLKLRVHNKEFLPLDFDKFSKVSQEIFSYECEKLKFYEDMEIDLYLSMNDSTIIRGTAKVDSSENKINIFINRSFTETEFLGVFAHELGHILIKKWTNVSCTPGLILEEGFATWLGSKYYLRWQDEESFNSFVKSISEDNLTELSHEIFPSQLEPRKRDTLYMECASFVEYLITNYGFNKICSQYVLVDSEFLKLQTDVRDRLKLWEQKKPRTFKDYQLPKESELNERNKILNESRIGIKDPRESILRIINDSYKKIYNVEFSELKKVWLIQLQNN